MQILIAIMAVASAGMIITATGALALHSMTIMIIGSMIVTGSGIAWLAFAAAFIAGVIIKHINNKNRR